MASQNAKSNSSFSQPLEEKQWVRLVREESDRMAFGKIFRAYYKRLHGFAYSYVKQVETAEDIIQTVFLRIWVNRESWNPPGTIKHYLFTAVRNEALNMLRNKKLEGNAQEEVIRTFEEFNSHPFVDEDSDVEELQNAIHCCIEKLPSRCRQIFILHRRSGLTYSEIADHLNISVNTVTTQMGRALKFLRKNLADYFHVFAIAGLTELALSSRVISKLFQ